MLKNAFLSLTHSFLLLGHASAANPKQLERAAEAKICSDASMSSAITCLSTAIHAVQLVTDAEGSMHQACASINDLTIARQDLDRDYLNKLVCSADVASAAVYYKDGYETMARLAFVRMALFAAEIDDIDPSLTIFCPLLDLIVLVAFGLPAEMIFNAICEELFMPVPTSSPIPINTTMTPSMGPSMTISMSSGGFYNTSTSSLVGSGGGAHRPTGIPATGSGMPWNSNSSVTSAPTGYMPTAYYAPESTPCTETGAVHKRQMSPTDTITPLIQQLKSLLFAIDVIISRKHLHYPLHCNPDKWVPVYDSMGYDGDYTEAWICAAASGADLFPASGIQAARADFIIALQGLIFALNDPDSLARRVYCDYLDIGPLMTAELPYDEILFLVCFPFGPTLGSGIPVLSGSPLPTMTGTGTGGVGATTWAPIPTSGVPKIKKRQVEVSSYKVYN